MYFCCEVRSAGVRPWASSNIIGAGVLKRLTAGPALSLVMGIIALTRNNGSNATRRPLSREREGVEESDDQLHRRRQRGPFKQHAQRFASERREKYSSSSSSSRASSRTIHVCSRAVSCFGRSQELSTLVSAPDTSFRRYRSLLHASDTSKQSPLSPLCLCRTSWAWGPLEAGYR